MNARMRTSLVITLLILLGAALAGWRQQRTLTLLRAEHEQLVAEAAALGIPAGAADAEAQSASAAAAARRQRAARDEEAAQFAREAVAFARDLKALQERGAEMDDADRKRIFDLLDRMLGMDSAQLKVVIEAIRVDPGLDDEMRRNLLGFAITMLANDHPQAALALFDESRDMLGDSNIRRHLIPNCLSQWAAKDPLAALEWLRRHGQGDPELMTEEVRRGLIGGTARQDPALAFRLIGELEVGDAAAACRDIAGAARSAAERTAVLAALRAQLAAAPDPDKAREQRNAVLGSLAPRVAGEGFAPATAWLQEAALDEQETTAFVSGLSHWQTRNDTGRWIDWLGGALPAGAADAKVSELVSQWTHADYQAAGEWLNQTAAGPVKSAATKAYAQTVAPYDGATAARWALSMPAGPGRDEVLRNVHAAWAEKDPAAAAAFAREHGIAAE